MDRLEDRHMLYRDWNKLIEDILSCTRCRLHTNRTNAVPGEGVRNTDIMIVGEAPGRSEDEQGRPFVGAAGNLLTRILRSVGIERREVYITNVVKCRPPGNREPLEDEIDACSIYLLSQLIMIKPKIIITLGNHAGKWFADRINVRWSGISRMRGHVLEGKIMGYRVWIVPTYHPAAALRRPQILKYIESDIKTAVDISRRYGREMYMGVRKSLLDFITNSNSSNKD